MQPGDGGSSRSQAAAEVAAEICLRAMSLKLCQVFCLMLWPSFGPLDLYIHHARSYLLFCLPLSASLSICLFLLQLDDHVHKLMPRLPIALQEATSRMASRDPTARPTAQLLQLIKYFM